MLTLSNGNFCTATMIDEMTRDSGERQGILLAAKHCNPEAPNKVWFFKFQDAGGRNPLVATVREVRTIPNEADLALVLISFGRPSGRGGFISPPAMGVEFGLPKVDDPATVVGYGLFDDGGTFRFPDVQRQGIGKVLQHTSDAQAGGTYRLSGFVGCSGDSGGPVLTADGKVFATVFGEEPEFTVPESDGRCGTVTRAVPLGEHKDWIESTRQELRG